MKGPRAAVSAVEAAVEDIAPRWISATRRGPARGLRAGRAQVGMGRRSLLAAPALDAPPAILITILTDAGRNGPRRRAGSSAGPRDQAAARPRRGSGPDAGAVTGGAILVVDDDPSILATVQEILALEGYPVTTAVNGAEALRSIEQARPALVLLDMRMPVLDGWGFADALKARGLAVPVLVMTAAQDARRWAAEIAAAGYIAKPFGLLDLLRAVARFVPPPPGDAG